MGIYSFRGGVHPKGYKELTADKPLVEYLPKGELVFPLSQHLGKPAIPVVKRNDLVKVGQLIAKADGFISANIHSSVSGKVKIIEHRPNNAGIMGESIVIINDGEYTPFEGVGEKTDYETLTPREIIDKVKEAGIVGLGGAGFPTYVKLMPQKPEDIRWIVANGAECEPGITCDDRLMQEHPEQIVEGLKIVLRIFPTAKAVIAIETNKPKAIESMRKAVGNDPRFEILELKVKYPQGGERNLVHAVSGQYMESGALPASLGVIVDNVATLAAIYRAVAYNEPVMTKGFTATGDAFNNPGNFTVRLGTSLKEIIEAAGGLKEGAKKIILGGPMMGPAISNLDAPIVKANNALTAYMEDEVEKAELQMNACIRCGRCTRVCPLGLMPQQMAKACERGDIERFVKLSGADCIQCGTCSFICPAKRPLTQLFKQTKPVAMSYIRMQAQKKEA
jgi:electron transport complex protein RnfC